LKKAFVGPDAVADERLFLKRPVEPVKVFGSWPLLGIDELIDKMDEL
jgi:hypothetical protein